MASDSRDPVATRAPGVFSGEFVWITIGACALVFLGAFESLAVTTIMPLVSSDLDGASLYALAFAGPLATGVVGMVVAGNWSDRRGPLIPLYASSALFALGLLIAGLAVSMPMLVAGRLVQGLGTGAVTVALYVIVARIFPARLHPSIFAGFAAAWVVPSLIGPYFAGLIAQWWSWHWVFLGVVGLVVAATVMVAPAVHSRLRRELGQPTVAWEFGRIVFSVVAASAVLALSLVSEVPVEPLVQGGIAVAAVAVVIVAVRPLVPRGTLLARRRLPSVILLRGVAAASFFGAEVYLPYLFIEDYAFEPAMAGLALTTAAIAWAVTSWLQGRLAAVLSNRGSTVIGSVLVFVGIIPVLATAYWHLDPAIAIVGWTLGGGGMGLMYPRISTMVLAYSNPNNQGFNSSAMSIGDSLGGALSLAVTGLISAAFASTGQAFAAVFAFTALLAVVAIAIAPRVAGRGEFPGVGSEASVDTVFTGPIVTVPGPSSDPSQQPSD